MKSLLVRAEEGLVKLRENRVTDNCELLKEKSDVVANVFQEIFKGLAYQLVQVSLTTSIKILSPKKVSFLRYCGLGLQRTNIAGVWEHTIQSLSGHFQHNELQFENTEC